MVKFSVSMRSVLPNPENCSLRTAAHLSVLITVHKQHGTDLKISPFTSRQPS